MVVVEAGVPVPGSDVWLANGELRRTLFQESGALLAIEYMEKQGKRRVVGRSVFDTLCWIGRFIEIWEGPYLLLMRRAIRAHIGGSARATGPDVLRALKERVGPKWATSPHLWSALAVALTAHEAPERGFRLEDRR